MTADTLETIVAEMRAGSLDGVGVPYPQVMQWADRLAALRQQQGQEIVGWISPYSLACLRKCRNDAHNGYAEVWMRARSEADIPLAAAPEEDAGNG